MSELEARDDDLTAREAVAGGPQAMVEALVTGLRRQGRWLAVTAVSVALDIILSIVLTISVVHTNHNSAQIARAADIAAAAARIKAIADWQQCDRGVINNTKLNNTNKAIRAYLGAIRPQSAQLLGLEKIYANSLLTIRDCGPEPAH